MMRLFSRSEKSKPALADPKEPDSKSEEPQEAEVSREHPSEVILDIPTEVTLEPNLKQEVSLEAGP